MSGWGSPDRPGASSRPVFWSGRWAPPTGEPYDLRPSGRPSGWGTALVVVVALVCSVALGAHLARYVDLAAGRLDGTVTSRGPAGGTGNGSGDASDGAGAGSRSDLAVPASCRRPDNPATGATFPAGDAYSHDLARYGAGAELQRLYRVSKTTHALVAIDGQGPVRDCDARVWKLVTTVAPVTLLDDIDEFMLYDSGDDQSGAGVVVGEVAARRDSDASSWRLSIAPNGLDSIELAIDISHEVGHLRSLDTSQLDEEVADADHCQTYWTGEGCLREAASLLTFLDDTWSTAEVKAWQKAYAIDDDTKRDKALAAFYDAHAGDFVTDYAATDPAEDYAETFAYWCVFGPGNPLQVDYMPGDASDGSDKLDWMESSRHDLSVQFADGCGQLRALSH